MLSYSQVWWRHELRPLVQDRVLGFPVMTSGWFITVREKMWNTGRIFTWLPTPCQTMVWMSLCILHAQCGWSGWLGAVVVAYRRLSWEIGRVWGQALRMQEFLSGHALLLARVGFQRLASLLAWRRDGTQLQIIAQQPWQPFFFFLGWKMVRMASSKTALRPFWVRAEHSK